MRKIVQKTSFLGGEAGPLLTGRSDLAQFQLGSEPGQNFIALKGGPVTRRPGTRYVKGTQANKPARLVDFVVSYDSSSLIFVVEIALASSTSLTFRVIRASDNSVFTPTGNAPLTVSAMTSFSLNQIQYAQVGNALFIVSPYFTPQVLTMPDITTAAFTLADYVGLTSVTSRLSYESLPYMTRNTGATTLSIDVATVGTGRVVTASTAIFNTGHVGAYFRMRATTANGWFKITALGAGTPPVTTATVEVVGAMDAVATATTDWSEGSWSTLRGFPRTVTFYNQRAAFGGTATQPDTFWLSQVSDYYEMSSFNSSTPFDASGGISDSLNFALASNKLNEIKWMVGGKKLTIGTGSSEWVGTVSNDGTNLFVDFNEETNHGSAYIQAKKIAYSIPFVQRSKRVIREMNFNFDSDSYVATDLNLFASHVSTNYGTFSEAQDASIVQTAYQESPFGVFWVIDGFGRLYGLTRDIQQQIAAWHSHVIGGELLNSVSGLGVDAPAYVRSICVVPSPSGDNDRLWMVVRRSINGVDSYYVEFMDDIKTQPYLSPEPLTTNPTSSETGIYAHLDCASDSFAGLGLTQTTWTGYTQFASSNVYVICKTFATGLVIAAGVRAVSAAGEITTPECDMIIVGLHVDAILRLLPMEGGSNPELTLLGSKSTDTAVIRLFQTMGLRMGLNKIQRKAGLELQTTFEPIPFDMTDMPKPASFTGTKEIQIRSDTDKEGSFALAMQEPWPCTIISISSRVVSNEV